MKENKCILIVDEDKTYQHGLKNELSNRGFEVFLASSAQEGIDYCIKKVIDLIILELNLSDHDGMWYIENLRSFNNQIPIIVVTKRGSIEDKVLALDAGANDYLVKPFNFLELLARMRKEFRYLKKEDEHTITNGPLEIDYNGKVVYLNGKEVHLTNFEYKILLILASNMGKVVSYNELISQVWGVDGQDQNGLRVFMAGIRRKVEKDKNSKGIIATAVNQGYKMNVISEIIEEN